MAIDMLVDSEQLDGAIKATAEKIREKSGDTGKIPWDMGTGFANAVEAITAGGNINLHVIAVADSNSLPETADEGTIAVVADTAIGDVYVQAAAPETGNDGDVFITTASGTQTIDIADSGSVELTIGAVSVYSGGTWSTAEAYVFINGAWAQLSSIISRIDLLNNSVNAGWVQGEGTGSVTRLDNTTYIQLKTEGSSANRIHVATAQKYSFKGKKTLYARFNPYTLTDGDAYIRVGYGNTQTTNLASLTDQCTRVTATVEKEQVEVTYDISALDGEYYVIIGIGKTNATVRFNTCYLE